VARLTKELELRRMAESLSDTQLDLADRLINVLD